MTEVHHQEAAARQATNAGDDAQPARVLAASVGHLLEDAERTHLGQLRQLRSRLQSAAFAWDNALLAHAVEVFLAASRELVFQPLRERCFWPRLTGATEAAARAFGRKYDEVLGAASRARHEFEMLSRDDRAHTSSARKLIVELDMEYRDLDREIDQGAEWLVELSYAIEKAQPLCALSARAMALSGRLKRARQASALARDITILGHNVLERRAVLLERVKIDLQGFDKVWLPRVANIRAKAADQRFPPPVLDKAREVHAELITRLELTSAACLALQMDEQAMARGLAMLRDCLEPGKPIAGSSAASRTRSGAG